MLRDSLSSYANSIPLHTYLNTFTSACNSLNPFQIFPGSLSSEKINQAKTENLTMSSTSAPPPPPPPLPYSGFFGDNYEVSDAPPLPEAAASSSSTTGMSYSAVIIVIVFSITVIVSISLCFLIQILRGRSTRRLHTDEQLGRSGGGGGSSRVMASRRVQPIDDQHILPIFSYEYANRTGARVGGGEKSKSASGGGDCPICLSKFEPKDNLRLLPICCHAFHAECVDLWLESNQSCPLCRSPIVASEAEILQKVLTASTAAPTLRPDPVTLRPVINQPTHISVQPASLVRAESNKTDIGANGSWLRDYMETLSSRTSSFRSSGRYFSGSSGRSEMTLPVEGYWDMEASRAGEEISEMFRWFSGI